MIDFSKLNKNKTYLGLQFGRSIIAKTIAKFSKMYCPTEKQTATHALAFVYENECWNIYESHLKPEPDFKIPSGVRRYKLADWLQIEENSLVEFRAYPIKLDVEELKKHIGEKYSKGDIKSLLRAALFHTNGKQKDRDGLICSEYIALAYKPIQKYFKLPPHCITPAHFQNYVNARKSIRQVKQITKRGKNGK